MNRLPEGWHKTTLGEISQDIMYGMNAKAIPYDGEHKYIRITDIDEATNRFTPNPLSSPDGEIDEKYKLKEGDILFARTGASVGKSYLFNEQDGNLYFAGFLIKFHITQNNPIFIYSQTQNSIYWSWVKSVSMRSGQPGINAEEFRKLPLIIAPLQEQRAIADILQAWDTAIEKTEALIAAKEKQFDWLKKQLFDGDFKSYSGKLADYASIPRQTKITSVNGLNPLTVKLHCNGIKANERDVQIFLSDKGRPYYQRKSGEFLIGRQNFHNGGFGIVPEELDGFIASNAITTLELDNSKLDTQYLFFFFSRKDYYLRISHIADGTGQKELSDKQIMNLPVSIPSLEKQQKVVHILNTANSEIDTLKTLVNQYRTQKRGLLQKLLTGKLRVKA